MRYGRHDKDEFVGMLYEEFLRVRDNKLDLNNPYFGAYLNARLWGAMKDYVRLEKRKQAKEQAYIETKRLALLSASRRQSPTDLTMDWDKIYSALNSRQRIALSRRLAGEEFSHIGAALNMGERGASYHYRNAVKSIQTFFTPEELWI